MSPSKTFTARQTLPRITLPIRAMRLSSAPLFFPLLVIASWNGFVTIF
ncbi:hypothetical protein LINPERPRIM_LOCUS29162 [Linum perenne]